MSQIPDIDTNYQDGYAELIGDNYDSLQECFQTSIPSALVERLSDGQNEARSKHEGQGNVFEFGGEIMQIWSGGSQGHRWVLENDDFQIHFRTDKDGWNISVRYRAAGLWEYGHEALRRRVIDCLLMEVRPLHKDWITLSWVHYAFDFYSKSYSQECASMLIAQNMLLTSGVKAGIVMTSKRIETLTIGMNRKGVQIQIYDKGKEITDISGKTWMYEIWERAGYYPPEDEKGDHVYRVELRFGKEFLKDRNIRTFEDFREKAQQLMTEAMFRRRLVQDNGSVKKERWGLHPLWGALYAAIGECDRYVPRGEMLTGRRDEYINMLEKQQMGITRALSVLNFGHYRTEDMKERSKELAGEVIFDPKHGDKVDKCNERYRYLDDAQ